MTRLFPSDNEHILRSDIGKAKIKWKILFLFDTDIMSVH